MSSQEHAEIVRAAIGEWPEDTIGALVRKPGLDSLAALVSVAEKAEALAKAARELLGDDDMPNHWDDCVCSYCTRSRALRSALAAFGSGEGDTDG